LVPHAHQPAEQVELHHAVVAVVDHVDGAAVVGGHAVGRLQAQPVLPGGDERAVGREDLDAVVAAVGDEQAAGAVGREAVGGVERAVARALRAPR